MPKIAVCVATYKRPEGLAALLNSLERLETDDMQVSLIIADNDPSGSAEAVFDEHVTNLPFPSSYFVKDQRGIVAVRNALVHEARRAGADFIAFADDDQTAEPQWLIQLVGAAQKYDAAIVAPDLEYGFPDGTASSIQRCFKTPDGHQPAEGTPIRNAGTNGSLFRVKNLSQMDGPFDMRMNLSGGSDAFLGAEIRARGGKIVGAKNATITEHMPASRLNMKWIARRAWREGNCRAQEAKWITPSRKRSVTWTLLFAGYAAKNILACIPDMIRFRELPLRRIRLTIFGISGLWHMMFGFSEYEEYSKQSHGR